jgi:hypothetical protein
MMVKALMRDGYASNILLKILPPYLVYDPTTSNIPCQVTDTL